MPLGGLRVAAVMATRTLREPMRASALSRAAPTQDCCCAKTPTVLAEAANRLLAIEVSSITQLLFIFQLLFILLKLMHSSSVESVVIGLLAGSIPMTTHTTTSNGR